MNALYSIFLWVGCNGSTDQTKESNGSTEQHADEHSEGSATGSDSEGGCAADESDTASESPPDTDTDSPSETETDTGTVTESPAPGWTDEFTDGIDTERWFVPRHQWGGKNGGVAPENVTVSEGVLKLYGRGNHYAGDIIGYDRSGFRDNGKRTGAAVVSREPLGPGRYEISARVPEQLGAVSAIWTFHYQEFGMAYDDAVYADLESEFGVSTEDAFWLYNYCGDDCGSERGYYVVNHEIDIELPGRPDPMAAATNGGDNDPTFDRMLTNTWRGEGEGADFGSRVVSWACVDSDECVMPLEYTAVSTSVGETPLTDGAFHTLRFDWHTEGDDCSGSDPTLSDPASFSGCKRVEFYRDDTLLQVNTAHVPDIPGQLWLGIWFPYGGADSPRNWAGEPRFDTVSFDIDWVRYTPFETQPVRVIDVGSGERTRSEALASVSGPGEQVLPNDTHGQVWQTTAIPWSEASLDVRLPSSYLTLCEHPDKPGADCTGPDAR